MQRTLTLLLSTFITVIAVAVVLGIVFAVPVWLLWNWLVPVIFHGPTITYLEALGLYILCAFLFRSSTSTTKG